MTKEELEAKIASLEAVMPDYIKQNRFPGKVAARKQELKDLKAKLAELTGK